MEFLLERNKVAHRHEQLSNFIDQFVISNMYNVFRVIYVNGCKNKKDWYKNIAYHVAGELELRHLEYDVEVITYSYSYMQRQYVQSTYKLQNINGVEVVDACFNTIKSVSTCDMLVLRINSVPGQKSDYNCCYLFARK